MKNLASSSGGFGAVRPPATFDLTRGITREVIRETFERDLAEEPPEQRACTESIRAWIGALEAPPVLLKGLASACLLMGSVTRRGCSRPFVALGDRMTLVAGHALQAAFDPTRAWRPDGGWARLGRLDLAGLADLPGDPSSREWDRGAEAEGLPSPFWHGFLHAALVFLIDARGFADQDHREDREALAIGATCVWTAARRVLAGSPGYRIEDLRKMWGDESRGRE